MNSRFYRIAQLLFTSQISEENRTYAKKAVDDLSKIELDLKSWLETIKNNTEVISGYKGDEKSLVHIAEKYEETIQKQKDRYERIIGEIKKTIEEAERFHDVEMQDMIGNLSKTLEEYTKLYNKLTDLPKKIGEEGFVAMFGAASNEIITNEESLFDVIGRLKTYIMKNVLDEQALS